MADDLVRDSAQDWRHFERRKLQRRDRRTLSIASGHLTDFDYRSVDFSEVLGPKFRNKKSQYDLYQNRDHYFLTLPGRGSLACSKDTRKDVSYRKYNFTHLRISDANEMADLLIRLYSHELQGGNRNQRPAVYLDLQPPNGALKHALQAKLQERGISIIDSPKQFDRMKLYGKQPVEKVSVQHLGLSTSCAPDKNGGMQIFSRRGRR